MRDDGHMQGGGCHDRRRRDHTGRRRDSTDGHWERPSSRAFAIRRENGGRDFRMLPAALAAWMASAAAHQWWRWLTLMDDDPMSVTGYAIGALAVMLLPVVLVVPSLAAHGLIRPLRASLGDAVAVMAVAGLLSAAAAVTADSVRWHDAAHVQARDGPADVVAVVRVRSPAVSSTVRRARGVAVHTAIPGESAVGTLAGAFARRYPRAVVGRRLFGADRHGGLPFSRHAEHGVVWPSAAVADL